MPLQGQIFKWHLKIYDIILIFLACFLHTTLHSPESTLQVGEHILLVFYIHIWKIGVNDG